MTDKIYAVFVNYNFGDKISHAVNSVLKFKSIAGAVVIDNSSGDNSMDKVEKLITKGKDLITIYNKTNEGFDSAVNKAIKKALSLGANYIIPLDSDLDFSTDFIQRLYDVQADFVAPVLKFKRDGKWVYDYGGRVNWLIGRTTHLESSRQLKPLKTAQSSTDHMRQNWFDFVSGGCTLIRKKVFEKIGFFDEDYFLYFGDTELALRARRFGFKVTVDPTTFMWHTIQEHKVTFNRFKTITTLKGNWTFINKVVPERFRPIAWAYWFLLVGKVSWNYWKATGKVLR